MLWHHKFVFLLVLCVCVCGVCVHESVHACMPTCPPAHTQVCVWKPEVGFVCLSVSFSLFLLRQRLSLNDKLTGWLDCWDSEFPGHICLCLPGAAGVTDVCTVPCLCVVPRISHWAAPLGQNAMETGPHCMQPLVIGLSHLVYVSIYPGCCMSLLHSILWYRCSLTLTLEASL